MKKIFVLLTILIMACMVSAGNVIVKNGEVIADDATVDSTTLTVDETNNRVGIGTTSPDDKLDVRSGGTGAGSKVISGNSDNSRFVSTFSGHSSDDGAIFWDDSQALRFATATNTGGSSWNERMRIDSSGNVGIGTTNPNSKLTVYSDTQTSPPEQFITANFTTAGYAAGMSLRNSADSRLQLYQYTTGSGASPFAGFSDLTDLSVIRSTGSSGLSISTSSTTDLVLGTNNAERLRIDGSTGNVGIGDSSPDAPFEIADDSRGLMITDSNHAANQQSWMLYADGGNLSVSTINDDGSNLGNQVVFSRAGDVGIGTTTPATYLDGATGLAIESSGAPGIAMSNTGTGEAYLIYPSASNGLRFYNAVGNSDLMTLQSDGDLGIGTTDPGATRLRVVGSGEAFKVDDGSNAYIRVNTGSSITSFETGNVGIGTTNPGGALEIDKDYTETNRDLIWNGDGLVIRNDDTTLNNFAGIGFASVNSDAGSRSTAGIVAQVTDRTVSSLDADLHFGTTGADTYSTKMTIQSDGDVGIGTTSPTRPLSIQSGDQYGSLRIGAEFNSNNLGDNVNKTARIVTPGFHTDSADAFMIGYATQTAANILQIGGGTNDLNGASDIRFYTQFNSTVQSAPERMRINNGGDVGIGQTSPSHRLDVTTTTEGDVLQIDDGTNECRFDPDGSVTETCTSDGRLKENIVDTDSQLDSISKLRIRDFQMIGDSEVHTGVIAQEVMETHPELVSVGENGYYTVTGINNWQLIKAIQEQQNQIEQMQEMLNQQQEQINQLMNK